VSEPKQESKQNKDAFSLWFQALEERHVRTLSFQEVRRSVQALSSLYVERREAIGKGTALDGAGKRAAFACFFAPLHFLLIREIVRALGAGAVRPSTIIDLGCGSGVAGAAWALELEPRPRLLGIDKSPWALQEARWTYSFFGLRGSARSENLNPLRLPPNAAVIAAFALNELSEDVLDYLRDALLVAAGRGAPVLIVESISRRPTPWWADWLQRWRGDGGSEMEWRFRLPLPERLALLDKASGLNHSELTGRSLWLPGRKP
jgi:hypothetical protein